MRWALSLHDPKPTTDWQELSRLTQGQRITIERVRLADKNIAIEGWFELRNWRA